MSARPKLVQEGTPVNNNYYDSGYVDNYDDYGGGRGYYGGRGRGYGRGYGGYRGRGYGGRSYGRGYGGYGGYGGRGRYHSYGGYRGRGWRGGRGRGYYGGRGRYGGSSLQRFTNNVPPGPKTSISTRLVIGGGEEAQDQEYEHLQIYEDDPENIEQYQDLYTTSRERHFAETKPKAPSLKTRLVIGGSSPSHEDGEGNGRQNSMEIEEIIPSTYNEELHQIERMEGIESLEAKEPLVVLDGPNVAYAYADAMAGLTKSGDGKRHPDNRGLLVAANYFLEAGVRVLIVLPAPWFRVKPRPGDENQENAAMMTIQMEVLQELKDQGLLVAAPPRDDDDAYALTIGRREAKRAREKQEGGGFVLSNDMFRDAMERDPNLELWLKDENGRVSFAFCDMGSTDTFGDRVLDFIPNPRHPLVDEIERQFQSNGEEYDESAQTED